MKVICIDDSKLPNGAEVIKDQEYTVKDKFVNSYDQIVYILEGVNNEGRTRFGLPWIGYSATRFSKADKVAEVEFEYNYALN